MMKKFLSVLLTVLLLLSCMSIPALADSQGEITLSEDYQKLYYNGKTYSSFNESLLTRSGDIDAEDYKTVLSTAQKETIKTVYYETDNMEILFFAEINFKNGSTLSVSYLQDEYREEFDRLINDKIDNCIIDFAQPYDNIVKSTKGELFGEKTNISHNDVEEGDFFEVYAQCANGNLSKTIGALVKSQGKYYYVDLKENNLESIDSFYSLPLSPLSAQEITNKSLLERIKQADAFRNKYFELPSSSQPVVEISSDYQTLYYNGKTYSRVNISMLDVTFPPVIDPIDITLTPSQNEEIEYVEVTPSDNRTILWLYTEFTDGSSQNTYFLQNDYRQNYAQLIKGNPENYLIDFVWPEGNTVTVEKDVLTGNSPVVITEDQYKNLGGQFQVYAYSGNTDLQMTSGTMLVMDDKWYYVDHAEFGIIAPGGYFDPWGYKSLNTYPVTDPAAIEQLEAAEKAYYANEFGFFDDDRFMNIVAFIFLAFLFGLVPLAVLVLSLIMTIRNKGVYRKLFLTTGILACVTLLLFACLTLFIKIYGGI